jgi:hypothetical protein
VEIKIRKWEWIGYRCAKEGKIDVIQGHTQGSRGGGRIRTWKRTSEEVEIHGMKLNCWLRIGSVGGTL